MGIRTILFLAGYVVAAGGALVVPLLGVLGYMAVYSIGPENQWWAAPINAWGIRYSMTLGVLTAIGVVLGFRSLRWGRPILLSQEWLILLFLGVVWLSVVTGDPHEGEYVVVDHPAVKLSKLVFFVMLLTHVVTTLKDLRILVWTLIGCSLVLGVLAYEAPRDSFVQGRLSSVGGPDFREANVIVAYLGAILPLIGIQFLRSKWLGKAVCLAAGVLAVNAVVLTRSRGGLVGIGLGAVVALMAAPKGYRRPIALGLVVAAVGAYCLTDPGYWGRASTITAAEEERDASAQSRLEIWEGGVRMFMDRPLGVGVGNFEQSIRRYAPEHPGRDAHNTLVRCFGEIGLPGITVLLACVANAGLLLWKTMKRAQAFPPEEKAHFTYLSYALLVGLVTVLGCGMMVSLPYVEFFWWFLALPACLWRACRNLEEDLAAGREGGGLRPAFLRATRERILGRLRPKETSR